MSNFNHNAKLILCSLLALGATSCASLNSVSMTQIPEDRSTPIEETVSDWSLFGINFSNDFAEGIRDKMAMRCNKGKVTGLMTKYEDYLYFIVVKRQVKATGYCVRGAGPSAKGT